MKIKRYLITVLSIALLGFPIITKAQLAESYPNDVGIQNDPDVLYVEMFDDGMSNILSRYVDKLNTAGMSLDTDVPAGSAGHYSLKMTSVTGGVNDGGYLFKRFAPGFDGTIYVRYYVKYPSSSIGYFHHEGVWFGGYNPALDYPFPHAGTCGLGSGRLSIAYENVWQESNPPGMDTYLYWGDMQSFDDGKTCFGNTMINEGRSGYKNPTASAAPVDVPDQWMCVEIMIKLNDPVTASNGELKVWQNGEMVGYWGPGFPNGHWMKDKWYNNPDDLPFKGFRWRTDPNLNINWLWFEFFHNNPKAPSSSIKFANLVVAKKYIGPVFVPPQSKANRTSVQLRIDGAEKFQQIDGFGMNINTSWWYEGKYGDAMVVQPAIDCLIDSLGATIFRAVIEEIDWEKINDNNDPDKFNWKYYNKVFSDARFRGVWNTLHYLNARGITKGLILSFMGGPPAAKPLAPPDPKKSWMGGTDYSISPGMEDEFVESIAALLYYARYTEKVEFTLVSPANETEQIADAKSAEHPDGVVEGPNIPDAVQYVRIIKKLAKKLDALGMSDIRFVTPDAAGERLFGSCLQEMVKDPYLMGKLAHWGVHAYGNNAKNYNSCISKPEVPNKSFWVTETAGIGNMLGQLGDDAKAYIFWDGFDCVYHHARRNGYGDVPPNDWVFWQPEDGKPMLEYIPSTKSWTPRKQFYQFAQLFRFVKPGAIRIGSTDNDSNMVVRSFLNPDGQLVIVGFNRGKDTVNINGTIDNLPAINTLKLVCTNPQMNLHDCGNIILKNNIMNVIIPPDCIFTLTGYADPSHAGTSDSKPEPDNWYAGDMHIHRNCGEGTSILAESEFTKMMEPNDLAVISVLADMGDGEVKDSRTDLPKVNGTDASQSKPGRIVHYDAEWHFDPAGTTFEHKALGGHLVMLGLKEAHTIWDESPYKILEWGKKQNAVMGFCHMEYLKDSIPGILDCCTPIDFPVEAALGTIDFLAEDVWLNDASVKAYYRLLNCGFRLGWAAGTDFPCNNSQPFGSLLTFVQIKDKPLTYMGWIEGIRNGRTVVTTNGHQEFLDLIINGTSTPGDEINIKDKETVSVRAKWTSLTEQAGRIELIMNGKVIATQNGKCKPGEPVILEAKVPVKESSWICARRMDETGHRSHTAPVYVSLRNAPVRASAGDARYFISWIDLTIANTSPGGPWNKYFTHDLDVVQKRYLQARAVYEQIAIEARMNQPKN